MDYADAVVEFESQVDRAVQTAINNGLTVEECIKELQRIAQGWKDSQ